MATCAMPLDLRSHRHIDLRSSGDLRSSRETDYASSSSRSESPISSDNRCESPISSHFRLYRDGDGDFPVSTVLDERPAHTWSVIQWYQQSQHFPNYTAKSKPVFPAKSEPYYSVKSEPHGEYPSYPAKMTLESWAQPLTPPLSDFSPALSPASEGGYRMPTPPDWTSQALSPPVKRRQARPRPYDKQAGARGRRQITEEERKLRKKEQNKSAATRYRMKKKEEQEHIGTDQDVLESRNGELKDRVTKLTNELSYLKQLMQQVMQYQRAGS